MTVTFRPMRADDAMTIERQPSQRVQLGLERAMTAEIAEALATGGEAWTALRGDRVVACVGLSETFHSPGHDPAGTRGVQAVAWAILSSGIGALHLPITRFTARRIVASPYRRIEAIVVAGVDAEAILSTFPGLDQTQLLEAVLTVPSAETRWATALGLKPAHVLRMFGAKSETHVLFERIA